MGQRDMIDTMTVTKALGAFCAMFLVLLLGKWAAETIYHVGGHGKHSEQAYVIDTGAEEGVEEVAEEVDFETVFASADAGAGERLWRQCQACHKLDGTDGTGPHLNGVVDRAKAAVAGYAYSDALLAMSSEAWTPENLQLFLEDPRGYAQGTKMSYSGMRDIGDRANLIAYLATTE
jgi:cytochrome c